MNGLSTVDLGRRIYELRTKKGMSQNELAERAETTRTTISKWENGSSEPGATQLRKIADAFGVSIDYLCGNSDKVGEKICVLDTCIILDRPKVIDFIVKLKDKEYNKIVIPDIVIQELNYQKDNAKGSIKQRAWLAMVTIERNKEFITFDKSEHIKNENNDDRIMGIAKKYALNSINNTVHVLTNDVYFSLKYKSLEIKNLSIMSPGELEYLFLKEDVFDEFNTQNFISAIKTKDLNLVKKAYNPTVNINRIDSQSGRTPLIQAIRDRSYDIIEYLLSLDSIDLEKRDEEKYAFTPLLHCCQLKDTKAMTILIDFGANVNSSSRGLNKGNTPLMVCSWGLFNDGIRILIENDQLSYNQQDFNGYTALHKACIKENFEAIRILIKKIDNSIEDFNNKKAVEHLKPGSKYFERISGLFIN